MNQIDVREAALAAMNQCPDENQLTAFAQGHGSVALETHLDGCDSCRRAVAAAAAEHTLPKAAPGADLNPGQRINRYEVERELGRGGMGVVYMARDLTLDRHVALKLLHARRDEAAQARLLWEAQVMAKLAHQHVVPVFELGDWRGDLYLVMELVSGVTLDTWLKAGKHPRKEILAAFIQAGRGLAAAHAAGVVHRDFKPANVLMGIDGRARVTDFGLSRPGPSPAALQLPAMATPVLTREGTLMGTLVYMAPEQLDGKMATEQSDQFSFCLSLAEALSGTRPFDGATFSELAVSHAGKPSLARSIPSPVRAVLRKGLESDPLRRFTSMAALLNALERAQFLGWKAVAATVSAGLLVCGVIAAGQPFSLALASSSKDVVPLVPNAPPPSSRSEIMGVVSANKSKIRDCVASHFAAAPADQHGHLVANFGIGAGGFVDDLRIVASASEVPSSLAGCVLRTFSEMRFPETLAGERGIRFPIKF